MFATWYTRVPVPLRQYCRETTGKHIHRTNAYQKGPDHAWESSVRGGVMPGNQVDIKLRYLRYPSFTIYYNVRLC